MLTVSKWRAISSSTHKIEVLSLNKFLFISRTVTCGPFFLRISCYDNLRLNRPPSTTGPRDAPLDSNPK